MPSKERPSKTELPYSPEKRFRALAPALKARRGVKSVEHLEILRQSDPCYGSLEPSKERTGKHELTYDPVRRYALLATSFGSRRGVKSVEHLEILRQSDPCYGSLLPSRERPDVHELTYDPARRYAVLARLLKEPRGGKTFEHLRNLRVSHPSYHALDKSIPAPAVVEEEDETDEPEELGLRTGVARHSSLSSLGTSLGRLPRILSQQLFDPLDDEEDSSSSPEPTPTEERRAPAWAPPAVKMNPAYAHLGLPPLKMRRSTSDISSSTDGEEEDAASLRSAARTCERPSNERWSERSSNDTIASFLDDADVHASAEWSASAIKAELKAELHEGPSRPSMGKAPIGKGAIGKLPTMANGTATPRNLFKEVGEKPRDEAQPLRSGGSKA